MTSVDGEKEEEEEEEEGKRGGGGRRWKLLLVMKGHVLDHRSPLHSGEADKRLTEFVAQGKLPGRSAISNYARNMCSFKILETPCQWNHFTAQ